MPAKPAARLGDPATCPRTGHGVNAIATASSDVLFDGLPAARQGDATDCGGVITGAVSSTVLINGKPAALLGSTGDHGNVVIGGSGTVIIGDACMAAPFTPPQLMKVQHRFDSHFLLRDARSGQPLAQVPYRLTTASGRTLDGVTDGAGKTGLIGSRTAEAATLTVPEQTALVIA